VSPALPARPRTRADDPPWQRRLGRKLAGTSARFAPGGQGVVWGQSGLGPPAADGRHYIPSIRPYFEALTAMAERLPVPARPSDQE
jgi:hypothetical protein